MMETAGPTSLPPAPGELSVEAVVEGENLASHDITLSAVTPEYPVAETGTDAYIRLDFVNTGLDPLSSLSYEISHISGRAEGTAAFEPVEPRGKDRSSSLFPRREARSPRRPL